MPYSSVSELPDSIKGALPAGAEAIFMEAFNSSFEKVGEERAFQIGWAAVKNAGFKKNEEGKWLKSDMLDSDYAQTVDELCSALKIDAAKKPKGMSAKEHLETILERIKEVAQDPITAVKNLISPPDQDDSNHFFGREALEVAQFNRENEEEEEKTPPKKKKRKSSYDSYTRYDAVSFSKPKRTPQGFLQVSANLSRTGVFTYYLADGKARRELRLPEEVFNNSAVSSLQAAPVTLEHPIENGVNVLVKPANAKKFSVGVVSENIKTDSKFISASLTIMDEEAIKQVEKGDRRQISLGYTCDLEMQAGEWNGEKYDAIQRNIVYNHAAIVRRGRAGDEVCIRMDSQGALTEYPENEEKQMELTTIKLDGVDVEISKQAAKAFDALKAELETTKGQLDAIKADLATAEKARADAADPAKLHSAVLARVALINKAETILGKDVDVSAMTDRQIKEAAMTKANPDMKFDGVSDDYLNGFFDKAIESHKERNDSSANVRKVVEETAKNPANSPSATAEKVKQMWSGSWKSNK